MDYCLANEIVPWEAEEIPNEDTLFMRIHRVWFPDGVLNLAAFSNAKSNNRMSTDWNKYSTARDTRRRSQRHPPEDYAVVRMGVGEVRRIPDQVVVHSPEPNNRAHTDIFGNKKLPEVRVRFGRLVERAGFAYHVDDPDV